MLTQQSINDIVDHAAVSSLARYTWPSRGKAPIGYTKGMALCFALCLEKLMARDPVALAMVRVVEDGKDVFDQYQAKLQAIGLKTEGASEVDRLRALFVILTGLGIRESSGGNDIGQDSSAPENRTAERAEAGWFQQSWDSRRASEEIERLFRISVNEPSSPIDRICQEGTVTRPGAFDNYGEGDGFAFQKLCKLRPSIAVQFAAIGVRTSYTSWGPLIGRAAEVRPEADALFKKVQSLMGAVMPSAPSTNWFVALIGAVMAMFRRAPVSAEPPRVPTPTTDGPIWLRWAAKEVGFHETGTNRNISRYTKLARCGSEGDAWCAIFVNAGLEVSGIRGTRSAIARSFEHDESFVRLSDPALGAITTMWRGSPESGTGHVFFYLGENSRGILALGGNQDDQVCRQYEPQSRVVGYFWPKALPLPKVGKIIVRADADEGTET